MVIFLGQIQSKNKTLILGDSGNQKNVVGKQEEK
jgi:hypothetical protein